MQAFYAVVFVTCGEGESGGYGKGQSAAKLVVGERDLNRTQTPTFELIAVNQDGSRSCRYYSSRVAGPPLAQPEPAGVRSYRPVRQIRRNWREILSAREFSKLFLTLASSIDRAPAL